MSEIVLCTAHVHLIWQVDIPDIPAQVRVCKMQPLSARVVTFEGPDSVGTQDPSCGQPRKPATLLSIAKRMNLHS